jgi:hypothetical protein
MSFVDVAEAEWARAYNQKQILMGTKARIENKLALYGAYDRSQAVFAHCI